MSRIKDKDNIVDQINHILESDDTIAQATKDRLILMSIRSLLNTIEGNGGILDRLEFLERFKPYLQALVWVIGVVAAALLIALATGQLKLVFTP